MAASLAACASLPPELARMSTTEARGTRAALAGALRARRVRYRRRRSCRSRGNRSCSHPVRAAAIGAWDAPGDPVRGVACRVLRLRSIHDRGANGALEPRAVEVGLVCAVPWVREEGARGRRRPIHVVVAQLSEEGIDRTDEGRWGAGGGGGGGVRGGALTPRGRVRRIQRARVVRIDVKEGVLVGEGRNEPIEGAIGGRGVQVDCSSYKRSLPTRL